MEGDAVYKLRWSMVAIELSEECLCYVAMAWSSHSHKATHRARTPPIDPDHKRAMHQRGRIPGSSDVTKGLLHDSTWHLIEGSFLSS